MKRITIAMPTGHIMLGSIYWNQFFKFISVEDDSPFISFIDETNWLTPKLYERAKAEKYCSQKFNFWNLRLLPINTI
ncbi:MAG: hypothetical protein JKX79_08385 [Labilibaculum sp.]|nr:hypothetical protein [Labilibaculum sp.]